MPLSPGAPVSDTIKELYHHGSRPRSREQIIAIAEANHRRHAHGGFIRRDDGGGIGPITPSASTQSPIMQNVLQRYQGMSPEQLQELAVRLGGTQQGQIVQRVLQQKRAMPNSGMMQQQNPMSAPMAPQAPTAPQSPMAKGGMIKRAIGGFSPSVEDPWYTRVESRDAANESGFLHGSTPGRADSITTSSPAGSYIIPSDVVSGISEGNSLSGARVLDEMLNSNPWGIAESRQHRGSGPPRPPRLAKGEAKGGGVQDGRAGQRIPVMLSHGEYQVSPNQVRNIGRGNIHDGHKILDEFVKEVRRRTIAKMKKLPGPAK